MMMIAKNFLQTDVVVIGIIIIGVIGFTHRDRHAPARALADPVEGEGLSGSVAGRGGCVSSRCADRDGRARASTPERPLTP